MLILVQWNMDETELCFLARSNKLAPGSGLNCFSGSIPAPYGQGITLPTLKDCRLTRKWTLADIRRLDCSIVKTNDQRFGNMKGKGKKSTTERLGKKRFGRRPERTYLGGH